MTRVLSGLILVAVLLAGCSLSPHEGGYVYDALNDSDQPVILDVRMDEHQTVDLAPHSYSDISYSIGTVQSDWTVRLVDRSCRQLQTVTVDAAHNLVYVTPAGHPELAHGDVHSYGLGSATRHDAGLSAVSCP
ncbi:MAG: hypothetical protein ACHQNA_12100 [Acidimicrobiales bacterium]